MFRYDIINQLIKSRSYTDYLEIGTQHGTAFDEIKLSRENKVCVDLKKNYHGLDHEMSSDQYFATHDRKFDIIFIDGDHSYEQSYKDILNAEKHLKVDGSIVCHDCYPPTAEMAMPHYMGGVYKSIVQLVQERRDLDIKVVDTDCGCGIIQRDYGTGTCDFGPGVNPSDLIFENFIKNAPKLINLISIDKFMELYK